jgi:hypothetical protein
MAGATMAQWAMVFVTAIVGAIALWVQKSIAAQQRLIQTEIADRQAKLDEEKIRQDLFDKRYAVYTALDDLVDDLVRHRTARVETIRRFEQSRGQARFLFDGDVVDHLNDISQKVFDHCRIMDQAPNEEGPKRKEWEKRSYELESWLHDPTNTLRPDLFDVYLSFRGFRGH